VRDSEADPALARAFFASTFRVMPRSDRSGVRLDPGGPLVPAELADAAASRTLISRRVGPGTIQCPSAGEAIALAADGPTTGGYAVVACVATVDLPAMGQVRPGEFVRFEEVSAAEADTLLASQRDWMSAALPSAISR
jgi:allophanate hydrolase subunit 2